MRPGAWPQGSNARSGAFSTREKQFLCCALHQHGHVDEHIRSCGGEDGGWSD